MSVLQRRIGIAGAGGVGLASAAWLRQAGHAVTIWSPRTPGASAVPQGRLRAEAAATAAAAVAGLAGEWTLPVAEQARALCEGAEVLLLALPATGHQAVMDALLPHLRPDHVVIVSAMASLSALYLHEAAARRGLALPVVAFGSTTLTARREAPGQVRVLTRRGSLGLSALPRAQAPALAALCRELFGDVFVLQDSLLATVLSNTNPVAHGPLALFNWTRIERAEAWPQYQMLTPRVAAVIEALDAERLALAAAYGQPVRSLEQHFAQSFGTRSARLADIAAELHAARGGPPGPTATNTRFLHEDMPFGLAFALALGRIAGLPLPATRSIVETASLLCGEDFAAGNPLIAALGLAHEDLAGLRRRCG